MQILSMPVPLQLRDRLEAGKEYYILVACKIGTTRLIDNIKLKIPFS